MDPDNKGTQEAWEERAAIMEYDGMLPRKEAERLASIQIKKQEQSAITNPVARAALEQCKKQLRGTKC